MALYPIRECCSQEVARHMVMGILPLGRNNNTFKSLFPSADGSSRARCGLASLQARIGEDCCFDVGGSGRPLCVSCMG